MRNGKKKAMVVIVLVVIAGMLLTIVGYGFFFRPRKPEVSGTYVRGPGESLRLTSGGEYYLTLTADGQQVQSEGTYEVKGTSSLKLYEGGNEDQEIATFTIGEDELFDPNDLRWSKQEQP